VLLVSSRVKTEVTGIGDTISLQTFEPEVSPACDKMSIWMTLFSVPDLWWDISVTGYSTVSEDKQIYNQVLRRLRAIFIAIYGGPCSQALYYVNT